MPTALTSTNYTNYANQVLTIPTILTMPTALTSTNYTNYANKLLTIPTVLTIPTILTMLTVERTMRQIKKSREMRNKNQQNGRNKEKTS